MKHDYKMKTLRTLALISCASFVNLATAACPTTPGRFVANSAEVTDTATQLVWARCSVGQLWSGTTCTGTATSTMNHQAALAYAAAQSGWRLPNVKELASITDRGCYNPAIDSTAFPAAPSAVYWSSSPYVSSSGSAWYINFGDGHVSSVNRSGGGYVRLVR
jgi:hypothetical protein